MFLMDKQKLKLVYVISILLIIFILISWFYFNFWKNINNSINEISSKSNIYLDKLPINKLAGSLYSESGAINLNNKVNYLLSKNYLWKASFLLSFLWDYKKSLNYRNSLCEQNTQENKEFCTKLNIKLNSNIFDTKWNKIDWVKIKIDWNNDFNENNNNLYNNFVHRIKFSKKWYLDSYEKIILWNWSDLKIELNPKLLKTNYIINIDSDKEISYKTKKFDYKIESNSFVNQDWTPISGKIDVYFFDIWASDWDLNVLNLDAFDENWTLLWNSMTSLWMPLVKAYSWENELKLSKEITWTWIIQNLERAPWIDLKNVPKNIWLNKIELDKYNIPPFWNLDQTNWVWKTSSMKILDEKWNYEFKLY